MNLKFTDFVPKCSGAPQKFHRGTLGWFRYLRETADVWHLSDTIQQLLLKVVSNVSMSHTAFLSMTSYLCEVGVFFCSYYKQIPCESQCGTGNESSYVQTDSKIWKLCSAPLYAYPMGLLWLFKNKIQIFHSIMFIIYSNSY